MTNLTFIKKSFSRHTKPKGGGNFAENGIFLYGVVFFDGLQCGNDGNKSFQAAFCEGGGGIGG